MPEPGQVRKKLDEIEKRLNTLAKDVRSGKKSPNDIAAEVEKITGQVKETNRIVRELV